MVVRCVSGMRPTGLLHLGNYFGALHSFIVLAKEYESLFFIADIHALTTHYTEKHSLVERSRSLLLDWLIAGLDPEQCTIFKQSDIVEHTELAIYLGMVTPLSWLERVPTYKEVREQSERDLSTYGFLGYPVLMTADILLYKAHVVPVGEDQLAHLEIAREIIRRINHIYGVSLPEPQAYQTPVTRLMGLDGRKMSKSYGNAIYLRDTPEMLERKIRSMITDTKRIKRTDPGDPKECHLFPYHELFSSCDECHSIYEGCTKAKLGCVDCKKLLYESMLCFFEPFYERMQIWDKKDVLDDILESGARKAKSIAETTMQEIRDSIGLAGSHR